MEIEEVEIEEVGIEEVNEGRDDGKRKEGTIWEFVWK